MKPESNFLKFASLFSHCYSKEDDSQAIQRIFGTEKGKMEKYPEKTSLQRQAKRYLESGGMQGTGISVIDRRKAYTMFLEGLV